MNQNKYILDLFAGAGGLSIGFERAGFIPVFANEIEKDFAETFKKNHPNVEVSVSDIKNLKSKEIFSKTGLKKGEISVIVGGPPCQGFSTVGKRWIEDPRNQLFREYFRVVQEVQPQAFVFENVVGLTSMGGGSVLEEIVKLFSDLGYFTMHRVLDAVEHGVPQHRQRVFIVGQLKSMRRFKYPEPTHTTSPNLLNHTLKPALTLKDAISDLPLISAGEEKREYASEPQNEYQKARRKGAEELMDHNAPAHGKGLLKVMSFIPEGGDMFDVPEKYRPKSGYKNTYARLWWNKPSTTVTRNFGTPSSSRCIHPACDRGLTTREGARLQSFDDDYVFVGSRTSRNLQIGNAVPPVLAESVARELMKTFEN